MDSRTSNPPQVVAPEHTVTEPPVSAAPPSAAGSQPPPARGGLAGLADKAIQIGKNIVNPTEEAPHQAESPPKDELIPDKKNLYAVRWGRTADSSHPADEVIDIGGNMSMDEMLARQKREEIPTSGERVDLDRELYLRISEPLQTLMELERQGLLEKGNLTALQRVMLEKFKTYESRYEQIKTRREAAEKQKQGKRKGLSAEERIFLTGEEAMQATAFVIETEIIAAHSLGYELTNGGQGILRTALDSKKLDLIEQAGVPRKIEQAVNEIAEALHLNDPEERKNRIIAAIAAAGTTGGAVGVGTLLGLVFGNPVVGAAAGLGVGIAVSAGEIKIGSLILSLEERRETNEVNLCLKFNPNLPGRPVSDRISDNLLARTHFLNQGRRTQDYITHAELTRHGIYSRLGLRTENLGKIDWAHPKNITPKQKALIECLGYDPSHLTDPQKLEVQRIAIAGDLWMVDVNPSNLSYPIGVMLGFDSRLRTHIQTILARNHPDLPTFQISTDVCYRDFSGLTMEERHKVVMEALSLAGIEMCKNECDAVLGEIAAERAGNVQPGVFTQIVADAAKFKNGELVFHESEITRDRVIEARRQVAQVKDKVTAIGSQHTIITEADGQITSKEEEFNTADRDYQTTLTEQGARGSGTGIIGQCEIVKAAAITEAIQKLKDLDIDALLATPIPGGTPTEATITDLSLALQSQIKLSKQRLIVLNPAGATADRSAIRGGRGGGGNVTDLDDRIIKGQEESEKIVKLEEALARVNECKGKIGQEEVKIVAAENLVKAKKGARDLAEERVKALKDKRQKAIDELRRLTGFKEDYGAELYNQLLATAQTEVIELKEKFEKEGIPLEEAAAGEEVTGKKQGVIVSKIDKERAEGMEEIATVGGLLNTKIQGLREMSRDVLRREFADPNTSQDHILRYLFGDKALARDKKPFYQRLLSKAGLVEAYFEYSGMDEASASHFFSQEPDLLSAYQVSRQNLQKIEPLKTRLAERHQLRRVGLGLDTEIKALEAQIRDLQGQNVQLLTRIYASKVAPFLGEHGMTTSTYMAVVIERMVRNASESDPFADAVQSAEVILPHSGPDGTTSILGPDKNLRDGSWINRGGTSWVSSGEYKVGGEKVNLHVNASIANTGDIDTLVEVKTQDLPGMLAVLPDINTGIVSGSQVEQQLNALGLAPHLYATTGAKRAVDEILDNWSSVRLPVTRPDMTTPLHPDTVLLTTFLQAHGLEATAIDMLYSGSNTGAVLNTAEVRKIAKNIIDKQIKTVTLQLQNRATTSVELAAWLNSPSDYHLGGPEALQAFTSLARTICEYPVNTNQVLLGNATTNRFTRVSSSGFEVANENGELRLFYQVGTTTHTISLKEAIQMTNEAARIARIPGFNNGALNRVLRAVGINIMEALRNRTS